MIRLTVISQTREEAVLEVHGWMSGGNVKIVEQEGMRLLGERQRLVLDLRGVKFIDREGIALLQRWSGGRLVLRGASPFVRTLLEKHGLV